MIGKISMGRSFKGCILYCIEDKKLDQRQRLKQEFLEQPIMKNRAELVHYNLCYGDKNELIKQFNEVRQLNQKLSKPVLHISLSLAPEDVIQDGKMAEMAEECAQKMGFSNNQYVAIYHKDTNHQHLHIVANRVGFDGKTVSDSHNYKKVAEYCRRMEQKLQLKEVLSPRLYLSQKERLIQRHDIRKEELKQRVKLSISQSRSYLEFEHRIKQYGYEVIRGRGIAFRDAQKVYVKGSKLGTGLEDYDYGQRIYDPQIGRFLTQDRFSAKYSEFTPYQYGADNPIKFIDKNGDSLIVSGNAEAVKEFQKITNEGLGGFYTTQQTESGAYTLVATGKEGEMNDQQLSFYNAMNGVMTGNKDVSIIAVMNDPNVDIGSFSSSTIDVGDMKKFNSINDPKPTGSTREGLLAHEVVEQNELQTSNVNRADKFAKLNAFKPMHQTAIGVENQVNGNIRIPGMEKSRLGDGTYTKYFMGKNNITVETTTNNTKDMQIEKRTIQLSINKPPL